MWEDLEFRSVSPILCAAAITCAILQGGMIVLLASIFFACLLMPAALKQMIGYIDLVLLGVYSGLLADLTTIGYFFLLAGGFGLLWTCFKKTSIPLVTMMGASYSLIISMQ